MKIKLCMLIIPIICLLAPIKTQGVEIKEEVKEIKEVKEEVKNIPTIEQDYLDSPVIEEPTLEYETRMTSYYAGDELNTGSTTGSGLSPINFEINDKGWYTYQGKLVVATATDYLLKYGFTLADGVHTYKYYDEITLNIDGIDYRAIVLDSCGSSMTTGRIDLFVSGSDYVKDTMIKVKED